MFKSTEVEREMPKQTPCNYICICSAFDYLILLCLTCVLRLLKKIKR
jgi:hypothetical protein